MQVGLPFASAFVHHHHHEHSRCNLGVPAGSSVGICNGSVAGKCWSLAVGSFGELIDAAGPLPPRIASVFVGVLRVPPGALIECPAVGD